MAQATNQVGDRMVKRGEGENQELIGLQRSAKVARIRKARIGEEQEGEKTPGESVELQHPSILHQI